ncbi:HupE/UreJ family protein [Rhodobacter sp. SGA-6-6]|uniref:HupE/UreJ family protein n=1 Tax=Rhodobacter sp. SGA-6-6 TaxID=2710882 RepID=UPI0013EE38E6|nr:HupE/UreJ family protein [Rhodobacter sp. SGA-6-6]NGM47665.1 HupE/UreJ family protein [Rhodobacter sp. SGA-6-6]
MKKLATAAIVAVVAGPALAHTGAGEANGFLHGLGHPVLGPDHLLAMLAVGLWSGFVLPRRFWAGAAAFIAAMAAGAGLSWAGIGYPMVETAIVGSVVVFGLLTLVSRRGQRAGVTLASLAAIAAFASAHGHAHATEASGNALAYLAGFLISTAALHLAGVGIARAVAAQPAAQRALGAGIALSGLWLMAG